MLSCGEHMVYKIHILINVLIFYKCQYVFYTEYKGLAKIHFLLLPITVYIFMTLNVAAYTLYIYSDSYLLFTHPPYLRAFCMYFNDRDEHLRYPTTVQRELTSAIICHCLTLKKEKF